MEFYIFLAIFFVCVETSSFLYFVNYHFKKIRMESTHFHKIWICVMFKSSFSINFFTLNTLSFLIAYVVVMFSGLIIWYFENHTVFYASILESVWYFEDQKCFFQENFKKCVCNCIETFYFPLIIVFIF